MKSEHRHELETNELSAGLAKTIETVKPLTGQIVTGLAALVLVYVGLTIWNAQSARREQAAWDAFALATDTSDPEMKGLQRIADDEQYAGTAMQEWAYVGWADRQVLNAIGTYLYDRERTEDLLRSVSGVYQQLASSATDPQVLNRARFGLARVYELQNKLDEARRQYLTVRGALQPQAEQRAEQLESESVREASEWLSTAELPKRDLTGGQGATGERPDFDAAVPAAQAEGDSISQKSLEELLGELNTDSPSEENRYGEQDQPEDPSQPATETDETDATDPAAE